MDAQQQQRQQQQQQQLQILWPGQSKVATTRPKQNKAEQNGRWPAAKHRQQNDEEYEYSFKAM